MEGGEFGTPTYDPVLDTKPPEAMAFDFHFFYFHLFHFISFKVNIITLRTVFIAVIVKLCLE